jgi:DNA-binding transcriptional LysR family regulator
VWITYLDNARDGREVAVAQAQKIRVTQNEILLSPMFDGRVMSMQPLPSWDLIRVFLALQRLRKFEAAASQLELDVTTVRRKLQKLERLIGTPLFTSDGGVVELREEHQPLLQAALAMEEAARHFANGAAKAQRTGSIRLSVIDILGRLLVGEFADFIALNPELSVDVTTETHFVDLDADKVDIAIRMARPERGRHGLRKLADVEFAVYGAHAYVEGLASGAQESLNVVILEPHFPHRDHDFTLAEDRWFLPVERPLRFTGRTDNYPMLHAMCQRGMGLALLPRFLGDFNPMLAEYEVAGGQRSIPVWLVVREDAAQAPKVRRLITFLVERFRRYAPLLDGRQTACTVCHAQAGHSGASCRERLCPLSHDLAVD